MSPLSIHIYCKIVDNHGDIGVCWRLARQLHDEFGVRIHIWVDDWPAARKVVAALPQHPHLSVVGSVQFGRWADAGSVADCTGDVVIEAFACAPPQHVLDEIAQRTRKPVHINLEYFTAESWVDGFHGLSGFDTHTRTRRWAYFQSTHPAGGGVLRERGLLIRRTAWQQADDSWVQTGGRWRRQAGGPLRLAIFGYAHPPYRELVTALHALGEPIELTVCGAHSQRAIAMLGDIAPRLHVVHAPFMSQPAFDQLLWHQHLLFVRGEDSLMRALWSGVPFVWNIYPQQERAHHAKLDAWLAQYLSPFPYMLKQAVVALHHAWNGLASPASLAPALHAGLRDLANWRFCAETSGGMLAEQPDLATRLMQFIAERRAARVD